MALLYCVCTNLKNIYTSHEPACLYSYNYEVMKVIDIILLSQNL